MLQRQMTNERGNAVSLSVLKFAQEPAITITGTGPFSHTQHQWTTLEAMALRDMLTKLLGPAV